MTSICSQVLGSNIRAAFKANTDCGLAPKLEAVSNSVAVVINDVTVSLELDSTYVPAGYTGTSAVPIYPGTILYFGTTALEVTKYAVLTTTPQLVSIKPAPAAVAITQQSLTFLSAIMCTSGFNIAAPPQTATNSTVCNGALLTDVNTGYKRSATITGFPDSKDGAFWNLIVDLGKELGSVYYFVDYNGQFSESGVMQLTFPDFQQGNVAQIQTYQVMGQVQNFEIQKGSSFLTPSQLTAVNTLRKQHGFAVAK